MDLPLWMSPTWYVVGAALVGAMLYYVFGGARQRLLKQLADDREPMRRWAKGVFGLITGGIDYGYEDKQDLRRALTQWWGINNAQEFRSRYNELAAEQPRNKPEAAWCWVRAVNLARLAAGAQFISHDESWRLVAGVLPRIQNSFAGWEELAQSYLAARDAWVRERNIDRHRIENVEDSIKALRAEVWRKMAFKQPLELAQGRQTRAFAAWDQFRVLGYVVAGAIDWAIRFRVLLVIIACVLAAGVLLAQSFLTATVAEKDLVGSWVGELVERGSIDDKNYDTRRWLMVVQPDRTANRIMRFYLGRQRQEEVVTRYEWTINYEWGAKHLVWRLACKENSPGYECVNSAYRISIDHDKVRYTGMSGRPEFTMRKVSADYRLP
jgi:hypothetical protein